MKFCQVTPYDIKDETYELTFFDDDDLQADSISIVLGIRGKELFIIRADTLKKGAFPDKPLPIIIGYRKFSSKSKVKEVFGKTMTKLILSCPSVETIKKSKDFSDIYSKNSYHGIEDTIYDLCSGYDLYSIHQKAFKILKRLPYAAALEKEYALSMEEDEK